jgi:hypothetical protein
MWRLWTRGWVEMRHKSECERVTHPNSLHPCNCGVDPGFCGQVLGPLGPCWNCCNGTIVLPGGDNTMEGSEFETCGVCGGDSRQ